MSPDAVPRLTSRPLPAYRHRPGQTPHPTNSTDGHSYHPPGKPAPALPDLNVTPCSSCEDFLFAVDLFNQGYWWECHEYLEALWHAAGHGTPAGHVLQSVIQCAAAHLKKTAGGELGARRLLAHAENHVSLAGDFRLGLDLVGLLADTGAFVTGAFVTGDSDQPARLVMLNQ